VPAERLHLLLAHGLDEVVRRAGVAALGLELVAVHGGHDDDGDGAERLVALLHDLHQLHAVHLGHHDVRQDEVHVLRRGRQRVDSLLAVHRGRDCLGQRRFGTIGENAVSLHRRRVARGEDRFSTAAKKVLLDGSTRKLNTRANSPNGSAPAARAGVAPDASGRVTGTYLGVHSSSAAP
jgi:hypothetical protein